MSAIKGLETAYNYYRIAGLHSSDDAFVVAFHSILLLFDFRCFGLATEEVNVAAETTELGSEVLPENWNSDDFYSLKYVAQKQVFIVKIVKILNKPNSNKLYINVLRLKDNKLVSLTFTVQDFVTEQLTDFNKLYINMDTLQTRIKKEVVDEVFPRSSIRTEPRPSRSERDAEVPLAIPARRGPREDFGYEHFDDPVRNVGRGDLDPLGGGGGMLLDHRDLIRHPRPDVGLPRGAVPPGARFYPVYPPGIGRGVGPDPDHLPPPGYDDMFG